MSEHTPGPWEIIEGPSNAAEEIEDNTIAVIAADGDSNHPWHVCAVWRDCSGAEANAHLIAAAPDLLAACKATDALLDGFITDDPDDPICRAVALLEAAIAKATGGT